MLDCDRAILHREINRHSGSTATELAVDPETATLHERFESWVGDIAQSDLISAFSRCTGFVVVSPSSPVLHQLLRLGPRGLIKAYRVHVGHEPLGAVAE